MSVFTGKKWIGNKLETMAGFLSIFILVARIFIQFEPLDNFPNDDSAVFLYIGRIILNGQLPYVNAWDHKGPLLYYINALGLWLLGLWGVWILEFILVFIGLCIAYFGEKKLFGAIPSFIGIIIGCYLLDLFMAGNITEEYSFSFALLTFGLYLLYFQNLLKNPLLFGIGFLFMGTILMRPNNIGFQSATILSMGIIDIIQKDIHGLKKKVIWIGLGMLTMFIPFLVYFGFNHALSEFYDQALRFNFIYIGTPKANLIFDKFLSPPFNFLFYIAIVSYGIILFYSRKFLMTIQSLESKFLLLLLLAFPLEFLLSRISGKGYDHYYITWAPYLIFASGFSVSRIFCAFSLTAKMNRILFFSTIFICFLVLPPLQMLHGYASIGRYFIYDRAYGIEKNHPLVDYIHDNTGPQDKVLRWGFGRWLTYLIDRESPTQYVYQFALVTPNYTTDKMIDEFANDLVTENPKFIIEAINYFIPINSNELSSYQGYIHPEYVDIVKFIEENYHVVRLNWYFDGKLKEDKWIKVWILNGSVETKP